MDKTNN